MQRTIYHEAAHLVIAKKFNYNITKVTVVPDGDTKGCVFYDWKGDNGLKESVYVHLAGVAMEMVLFGDYTMGCKSDIEKAQQAIRDLIEYGYSPDGIHYSLSETSNRKLEKRIDQLYATYLKETMDMVSLHRDEIESFVPYLETYRYLTQRD